MSGRYKTVFQGGVYIVDLSPFYGCEQGGVRPCVCVSNDYNNLHASIAQFVPLSLQYKPPLPMHCVLFAKDYRFLNGNSVVLCEQITTKSLDKVERFLGRVTNMDLLNIQNCIKVQLDL